MPTLGRREVRAQGLGAVTSFSIDEVTTILTKHDVQLKQFERTLQELMSLRYADSSHCDAQLCGEKVSLRSSVEPAAVQTSSARPIAETSGSPSDDVEVSVMTAIDGVIRICASADGPDQHAGVRKFVDGTSDTWRLGMSCWDAAVFLGHSDLLRRAESLGIIFLLLSSIAVQVGFTSVVWRSLGESALHDEIIQGYHWWRTNIGHHSQFMNPLTLESLASRVCRGDASLHLSEAQLAEVANINAYLAKDTPFNGRFMCILAMISWSITVLTEFHDLFDMASALARLRGRKTAVTLLSSGALSVRSLGFLRFLYLWLIILARAWIAGMLLIAGLRFLVTTISIEEILLNSIGLNFILNMDELLYIALAPARTRRLISLFRPFPMTRRISCDGLDIPCALGTLAAVISVGVAYQALLLPEVSRMNKAKWELCAGELSFSWALSPGGFVQWAQQNVTHEMAAEQVLQNVKMSSRYGLLRSLISSRMDATGTRFWLPLSGLKNLERVNVADVGNRYNAACSDKLVVGGSPTPKTIPLASLRDAIGNQSISICSEVAKYCNDYQEQTGVSARLFCPRTCGCHSPGTTLMYIAPLLGCPESCASKPSYRDALEVAPCIDLTGDAEQMVGYARNLRIATANRSPTLKKRMMRLADLILLDGCQAEGIRSLCAFSDLRSLSFLCPSMCQCNLTGYPLCPRSCLGKGSRQAGQQH